MPAHAGYFIIVLFPEKSSIFLEIILKNRENPGFAYKEGGLLSQPPVLTRSAAAVVAAQEVVSAAIAAAVAEQQDQKDDPANITTAETVIVTHKEYLRE